MIDREDIPLLNSFKALTNSLTLIIGSVLGSAIAGFVGIRNAFIIDALSFWISALMLLTIIFEELHVSSKEQKDG